MDETRQFLLQASLIPKNSAIITNLRSKVFNDESNNVKVDRNAFCKWCYSSWSDGNCSFKVEPQKKKKPRKRPGLPKRFNVLVIKCHVCAKSTKIFMPKEKVEKVRPVETKEEAVKKKKKKKKDPFAGLNPLAFSQLHTPKLTDKVTIKSNNKPQPQIKSNIESLVHKKSKKKSNKKKKKKTSLVTSFINDC